MKKTNKKYSFYGSLPPSGIYGYNNEQEKSYSSNVFHKPAAVERWLALGKW